MDKFTIWAMVEVRNEPFLGFSSLVFLNNRKKVNWKVVQGAKIAPKAVWEFGYTCLSTVKTDLQ